MSTRFGVTASTAPSNIQSSSAAACLTAGALLCLVAGCREQTPTVRRIDPERPASERVQDDDLLTGLATYKPPETPDSLKKKRNEVAQKIEEAEDAIAEAKWGDAYAALDRALYLDYKNRTAKFLIVKTLHARSLATESTDPHQCGMDIRQAGVYLTHLLAENDDFTAEEQRLFAEVRFDESRVYGRTHHREAEFAAAFTAAMRLGFDDLDRLKNEPDLQQFRNHPDTAPLIRNAIASLEANAMDSQADDVESP